MVVLSGLPALRRCPAPEARSPGARRPWRCRRSARSARCHAHPGNAAADPSAKKRVVVIGAGWAGLGAAWHLVKQGYDVDILEAGQYPGGLVAGWQTQKGRSVEVGIHGFWRPYFNIFALCEELGLQPFTNWTPSYQYSDEGLEVIAPIFQDMPRLPTPFGHFVYNNFLRLPLADRLSALPLLAAVADFDNSPEAWRRYDGMSARELFRANGVSERLYRRSFEPMLLVGLFAPGEECSAAAALGMLKFFILNHQADFDVVWCRGTVGREIFRPWVEALEAAGARFRPGHRVTGVRVDAAGHTVTAVSATNAAGAEQVFEPDAVVLAVGIGGLQRIVAGCPALAAAPDLRAVANLGTLDVLAVRIWLDRKVALPRASNAVFGFDTGVGWTFFDLNALHDEYADSPTTVLEADFYHANALLPLSDKALVDKVLHDVARLVPAVAGAAAQDFFVGRFPRAVTHFRPGCYASLLRTATSLRNVFAAGDWVVDHTHGSYSQEKAYVMGLEAASLVVQYCNDGAPAAIIPIEPEEGHVTALRSAMRAARAVQELNPLRRLLPAPLL